MNLKNLIRRVYVPCFYALSKVCVLRGRVFSHDECMDILKAEGYDFRPLWDSTPPLQPNSIDLSIVIPVYNSQKYLAKCLESILNQKTQYTYEVICVNDGSTDNSGDIIESYKSKFPNKLVRIDQENHGIACARNVGIEQAKGEYIGFLDNDDYVVDKYIESILTTAKKHKADIVQTGYFMANQYGEIQSTHSKGNHILDNTNKEEWVKYVQGYVWGGCYRKEAVFKDIRFNPGFWYEDMITRSIFIRQCDKIVVMGQSFYYHLNHNKNASKVYWKNNNIKSVDQYWLARSFAEYLIKVQHIEPDNTMYEILSHEWSGLLYSRTKSIKKDAQKAAFFLASEYMKEIGMDKYVVKEDDILSEAIKGLNTKNYLKWKFASMAYTQSQRIK